MTKVTVLGEEPTENKLTKIEFVKSLSGFLEIENFDKDNDAPPKRYNYIELICLNYGSGFDLMFAFDDLDERNAGCLFLGHFNDGVV